MKTLILLTLLNTIGVAKPRTITEPTVRSEHPPFYEVENPKLYPVTIYFTCGSEYDPVVFKMPARVKETFEIRASDGKIPYCLLDRWEKTR